jgi:tetratricopeptide (TPR) repeat protein
VRRKGKKSEGPDGLSHREPGNRAPSRHVTPPVTLRQKLILIAFSAIITLAALALLEGALFVVGYGQPGTRPDPFLGFEQVQPLFRLTADSHGNPVYATSPNRLTFFNHQEFPARKRPGTSRIFCFGGSSTYGRPYSCETAFPKWLEITLNSFDCGQRFEVINVGGVSYASYRVANLVAEVLESDYEPDLFVIYCGHNEFLEQRTYGDLIESRDPLRRARVFIDRFRTTTLIRSAMNTLLARPDVQTSGFVMDEEVDAVLDRSAGLDRYVRDDTLHSNIIRHYEVSLERMLEMAGSHDIPVVLVNMVYNLKGFSPFKSVHRQTLMAEDLGRWNDLYSVGIDHMQAARWNDAHEVLLAAAQIDPRYAELQYRIGRCCEALGDLAAAEEHYVLAKDEDICPLRATEPVNRAIARVSVKYGLPLVDLRSYLRDITYQRTECPILGGDLFLDHIHLTIEGYQLMALEIAQCMGREGLVEIPEGWDSQVAQPLFAEAEAALDPAYLAQRHLNLGKVLAWAGRKQEAEQHFALAAELTVGSAEVHYRVGKTHREAGRIEEAIREFRRALELQPDYAAVYNDLGLCYLTAGSVVKAQECFHKAMELRPDQAMPYVGLGRCYSDRGLVQKSITEYEKAVAIQPDYADGLNNLALAYQEAGRFDEAEAAFRKVTNLYPDFAEARTNLGCLYLALRQYDHAEAEFRMAIKTKPDLYQPYGNLGLVLLARGDRAGADAMFKKVLELNPRDQAALSLITELNRRGADLAAE